MPKTRIPAVDLGISEVYTPGPSSPFDTTIGWACCFMTDAGERIEITVLYAAYPGICPSLKPNAASGPESSWATYLPRSTSFPTQPSVAAGRTTFLLYLRDQQSVSRTDIDQLIEAVIEEPSFAGWLATSYPDPGSGDVGRVADGIAKYANRASSADDGAVYGTAPQNASPPGQSVTRMMHQVLPLNTAFPGPVPGGGAFLNLERPTADATWSSVDDLASFKSAAQVQFTDAAVRVGAATYSTEAHITTVWNQLPAPPSKK